MARAHAHVLPHDVDRWAPLDPLVMAMVATMAVSVLPFLMLSAFFLSRRLLVPLLHVSSAPLFAESTLRIFVCFAVGGLLGDVFLHLVPHSYSASFPSSSHSHSPQLHMAVAPSPLQSSSSGLLILLGMFIFFGIEKGARVRAHIAGTVYHAHGHSHSHAGTDAPAADDQKLATSYHSTEDDGALAATVQRLQQLHVSDEDMPAASVLKRRRAQPHELQAMPERNAVQHSLKNISQLANQSDASFNAQTLRLYDEVSSVSIVSEHHLRAMLNLIADLSHNFTDGIAIAASFVSSPFLGLSTTLAVLAHEIPHELGDFAILLQAGYSVRQALLLQLCTSIGAVLGVAMVGILGADEHSLEWILPITAGAFLYLALCNILPTVLNVDSGSAPRKSGFELLGLFVAETIAIISGVGMMYTIGLME